MQEQQTKNNKLDKNNQIELLDLSNFLTKTFYTSKNFPLKELEKVSNKKEKVIQYSIKSNKISKQFITNSNYWCMKTSKKTLLIGCFNSLQSFEILESDFEIEFKEITNFFFIPDQNIFVVVLDKTCFSIGAILDGKLFGEKNLQLDKVLEIEYERKFYLVVNPAVDFKQSIKILKFFKIFKKFYILIVTDFEIHFKVLDYSFMIAKGFFDQLKEMKIKKNFISFCQEYSILNPHKSKIIDVEMSKFSGSTFVVYENSFFEIWSKEKEVIFKETMNLSFLNQSFKTDDATFFLKKKILDKSKKSKSEDVKMKDSPIKMIKLIQCQDEQENFYNPNEFFLEFLLIMRTNGIVEIYQECELLNKTSEKRFFKFNLFDLCDSVDNQQNRVFLAEVNKLNSYFQSNKKMLKNEDIQSLHSNNLVPEIIELYSFYNELYFTCVNRKKIVRIKLNPKKFVNSETRFHFFRELNILNIFEEKILQIIVQNISDNSMFFSSIGSENPIPEKYKPTIQKKKKRNYLRKKEMIQTCEKYFSRKLIPDENDRVVSYENLNLWIQNKKKLMDILAYQKYFELFNYRKIDLKDLYHSSFSDSVNYLDKKKISNNNNRMFITWKLITIVTECKIDIFLFDFKIIDSFENKNHKKYLALGCPLMKLLKIQFNKKENIVLKKKQEILEVYEEEKKTEKIETEDDNLDNHLINLESFVDSSDNEWGFSNENICDKIVKESDSDLENKILDIINKKSNEEENLLEKKENQKLNQEDFDQNQQMKIDEAEIELIEQEMIEKVKKSFSRLTEGEENDSFNSSFKFEIQRKRKKLHEEKLAKEAQNLLISDDVSKFFEHYKHSQKKQEIQYWKNNKSDSKKTEKCCENKECDKCFFFYMKKLFKNHSFTEEDKKIRKFLEKHEPYFFYCLNFVYRIIKLDSKKGLFFYQSEVNRFHQTNLKNRIYPLTDLKQYKDPATKVRMQILNEFYEEFFFLLKENENRRIGESFNFPNKQIIKKFKKFLKSSVLSNKNLSDLFLSEFVLDNERGMFMGINFEQIKHQFKIAEKTYIKQLKKFNSEKLITIPLPYLIPEIFEYDMINKHCILYTYPKKEDFLKQSKGYINSMYMVPNPYDKKQQFVVIVRRFFALVFSIFCDKDIGSLNLDISRKIKEFNSTKIRIIFRQISKDLHFNVAENRGFDSEIIREDKFSKNMKIKNQKIENITNQEENEEEMEIDIQEVDTQNLNFEKMKFFKNELNELSEFEFIQSFTKNKNENENENKNIINKKCSCKECFMKKGELAVLLNQKDNFGALLNMPHLQKNKNLDNSIKTIENDELSYLKKENVFFNEKENNFEKEETQKKTNVLDNFCGYEYIDNGELKESNFKVTDWEKYKQTVINSIKNKTMKSMHEKKNLQENEEPKLIEMTKEENYIGLKEMKSPNKESMKNIITIQENYTFNSNNKAEKILIKNFLNKDYLKNLQDENVKIHFMKQIIIEVSKEENIPLNDFNLLEFVKFCLLGEELDSPEKDVEKQLLDIFSKKMQTSNLKSENVKQFIRKKMKKVSFMKMVEDNKNNNDKNLIEEESKKQIDIKETKQDQNEYENLEHQNLIMKKEESKSSEEYSKEESKSSEEYSEENENTITSNSK